MGAPEGEEWKGAFRRCCPIRGPYGSTARRTCNRSPAARRACCASQGEAGVRLRRRGIRGAAQTLRRSRRAADFRRDTDRHGPHGRDVRHDEVRRHARHSVFWPRPLAGMPLGRCRARRGDVDAHARSRAGTHNHLRRPSCCAAGERRCGMSRSTGLLLRPSAWERFTRSCCVTIRGAGDTPQRSAAGCGAGLVGEALPHNGNIQARGYHERLVPLIATRRSAYRRRW